MGALSEDDWLKRSTAEAIAAARKVVLGDQAVIPMMTPIGRLAISNGAGLSPPSFSPGSRCDLNKRPPKAAISMMPRSAPLTLTHGMLAPSPASCRQLADHQVVDWSKPLINWPRDDMLKFLSAAFTLIRAGHRRTRCRRQGDQQQQCRPR